MCAGQIRGRSDGSVAAHVQGQNRDSSDGSVAAHVQGQNKDSSDESVLSVPGHLHNHHGEGH